MLFYLVKKKEAKSLFVGTINMKYKSSIFDLFSII